MAFFRSTSGNDTFTGSPEDDEFFFPVFGGYDRVTGGGGRDIVVVETRGQDFYLDDFLRVFGVLPAGSRDSFTNSPDAELVVFSNDIEVFQVATFEGRSSMSFFDRSTPVEVTLELGRGSVSGSAFSDTLKAFDGDVELNGRDGDDVLIFQNSNGVAGTVRLSGGQGTDTARVLQDTQLGLFPGRFTVALRDGAVEITSDRGNVFIIEDDLETLELFTENPSGGETTTATYTYAELVDLAVPQIIGTEGTNTLTGTGADEVINALAGDDWIVAGGGSDTIDGGAGRDMVSYSGLGAGIRLGETASGFSIVHTTDQIDQLTDVERVTGTSQFDIFRAAEGSFRGLGGPDSFSADGAGIGHYDGGAGNDAVNYSDAFSGIAASLLRGKGWEGDARGDTYTDIENLTGTNFNDRLWGDRGDNSLRGLRGDDTFVGAAGDDRINGGNGFDTATFFRGVNSYNIDFGNGANGSLIIVEDNFAPDGDEGTDSLQSIEVLRFSDTVLTVGFNGRDVFTATEGFVYLRGGNDILLASRSDMSDGLGVFYGGSGKDILSYTQSAEGIYASLGAGRGWEGDAAGDRFNGFEWLRGTNFDDRLDGSRGNDTLEGGAGDDTLTGGFGDDYILAGVGFDTIVFSGNRAEYSIVQNGFRTEVTHLNGGSNGVDVIGHAEVLQFADLDVIL